MLDKAASVCLSLMMAIIGGLFVTFGFGGAIAWWRDESAAGIILGPLFMLGGCFCILAAASIVASCWRR